MSKTHSFHPIHKRLEKERKQLLCKLATLCHPWHFWEVYFWKEFSLSFKNVWVDVICKPFHTLEEMMHVIHFKHIQEFCS